MKKILHLLPMMLLISIAFAQKVNWKKINSLDPDKILMDGKRKPTKVLLLGTFHFGYPNLDTHKTDSANFIDVLSPVRQKEIQQLADVILRFKPTRFYIESMRPQSFHDSLYNEYVAGRYEAERNENYQVGYRVARQAGMKKLYPVDASSFINDYYKRQPWLDSIASIDNPTDSLRDKYWSEQYSKLYNAGDSVEVTLTILENFLLNAQPKVLQRMHGNYLAAGFSSKGNNWPDVLAMWWYSRNLRIFNNILQTQPSAEDRIVILFGNGHMSILRDCFKSSPEFEVVELKDLLK